MKLHGVYSSISGEPILNLNAIQPDCSYALYNDDIFIKESTGVHAFYDSLFRSALENDRRQKEILIDFIAGGAVYSKNREDDILKSCMKSFWREFKSLKIYIPYNIESIIIKAMESQNFILHPTHFCYSFDFSPLHFFGIKGITRKGDGDFFFMSDNFFTTQVLKIETKLLPN